ncbi:MAG: hypothetical protein ACO1OG_04230 [Devosia sp.]
MPRAGLGLSLARAYVPLVPAPPGESDLESITLTQIPDHTLFQRAAGGTSKSVLLAGATLGQSAGVQARVRRVSDDGVVVDWTTIDGSPGPTSFSGSITVPQGGPYYVEVRDAFDTGVGDVGTTEFSVGVIVTAIGQSNMNGMFATASSPPAAATGTYYFDYGTEDEGGPHFNGAGWTPGVPAANGVRELLNALRASLGIPVGITKNAINGAGSGYFIPGAGAFENVIAPIAEHVGDSEVAIIGHGEGDAAGAGTDAWKGQGFYDNYVNIHAGVAALFGRSLAQFPMIFRSLATFGASDNGNTDGSWVAVDAAIRQLDNDFSSVHYSHSAKDAVRLDPYHYDAASFGKIGRRFARTIGWVLGAVPTNANFEITAVEAVSATTTRFTLAHAAGTDFTPPSGISGFSVSADGTSWITGTGARVDATHILMTHAALAYPLAHPDNRLGRYQYGMLPDMSAPVFDNSALAVPLNHSSGLLLIDYANPVMTSGDDIEVDEGETFVMQLTASRPSGFALGGADAGDFELVAAGGGTELHFVAAADYDDPQDAGTNNVYNLTVTPTALDNGDTGAAQSVAIEVLEVGGGDSQPSKTYVGTFGHGGGSGSVISATLDVGAAAGKTGLAFLYCSIGQTGTPPTITVGGDVLTRMEDLTSPNSGGYGAFYAGPLTVNGSQTVTATFDNAYWNAKQAVLWVLDNVEFSGGEVASDPPGHFNSSIPVVAGEYLFEARYGFGAPPIFTNSPTQAADAYYGISNDVWGLGVAEWTIAATTSSFSEGPNYVSVQAIYVKFAP